MSKNEKQFKSQRQKVKVYIVLSNVNFFYSKFELKINLRYCKQYFQKNKINY